uniref:LIM zinc-binding domain-containing protein n=1 Tax=Plectus sambesii TaxID=2011161 RepID=A0A914VUY1_9BILA
MADTEDDPYAVSSDSEDEDVKKPPPKIAIEGRASDLSTLKAALASENEKEVTKDQSRAEEIKELKAAISQDLNNVRSNFESGNTGVAQLNKDVEEKPEREKLTAIDKEKYSQFKDKFEKLDETLEQNLEEKRKAMEREIYGAGAEGLSKAKDRFEKPQEESEIVREAIDIQRSDADKKRVQKAFNKKSVTEEDVPKECVICGKVVYPVEKVFANKRLYHKACFKCSKCNKSLTATNFNSHEGALLCKVHHLEVFHPELAKSMDPTQVEEEEHGEQADDEEGDYAVVSKPKVLDSSVVRFFANPMDETDRRRIAALTAPISRTTFYRIAGLKSTDDLATISSLRDKKGSWETSVQESQKAEKKTVVEGEMFQTGRVKSHQTKFTEGGSVDEPEEEEDESTRDPNVIRENRRGKKEELHFEQVGDIKNKWKTGGVEAAQENREDRSSELDELKKGLKVKERFQEKSATDQADAVTDRQSVMEKESIDTSWTFPAQEHPVQALLSFMRMRYVSAGPTPPPSPSSPFSPTSAFAGNLCMTAPALFSSASTAHYCMSSEARKAFLQGGAFETGPVEKTVKDDIQFSELGSFKERFEKGAVDEAPTEKTAIDVQCGELGNIKAASPGRFCS